MNNRGGVEAHFTVTPIEPTKDHVIGSEMKVRILYRNLYKNNSSNNHQNHDRKMGITLWLMVHTRIKHWHT